MDIKNQIQRIIDKRKQKLEKEIDEYKMKMYDTGHSTNIMEIQKDAQYLKEEMTGCIYRHFKGELYIVTDVVVNSESLEIEVIYKDFSPSQLAWSRHLKQFFSGINTTKYPDTLQKVRFKKVGRCRRAER